MCELQPPDTSFYIGILAGFLAIVTPIYQYFEKSIEERTFIKNGSQFIVALAGILTLYTTVKQWCDKREEDFKRCLSEQKSAKDKAKADSLQIEIYKIGIKNSEDLLLTSKELHESDEEIIKLNTELRYYEIGTKSYPTLKISNEKVFIVNLGIEGNSMKFIIENNSKFPINTLKYWLRDSNDKMKVSKEIMEASDSTTAMYFHEKLAKMKDLYQNDIGTLNNGESYILHSIRIMPDFSTKIPDIPNNRFPKLMIDDNMNNYLYEIQMRWKGGALNYWIKLTMENQNIKIKDLEIHFNGKKIKNYLRFLKVENI